MELTRLAKEIYNRNVEKGFWDHERNIGEMLMLVVSELGEAMEALRKGKMAPEREPGLAYDKDWFAANIKDTFEDEVADALIRILDMCGGLGINIDYHVKAKLEYNATRERLHGKKF